MAELRSDPTNANKGTVRGRGMLERSLSHYGAGRAPVASADGVILAGNKTVEVARELGIPIREVESDGRTLFVIRRTDLPYDDPRARELAIADNRTGEVSLEWAPDVLAALADDGVDLGQFWFEDELADVLAAIEAPAVALTDPDAVPEPPAEPITKPGDLWLLGRHRLLCGDSTYRDQVRQVLQGSKADLLFTDPPYGVNVSGKGGTAIAGDLSFTAIPLMFDVVHAELAPGAWIYICGGQSNMPLYGRMFERYFRQLPGAIIWDKGKTAVMRHNGYHSCYEMIYWTYLEGGGARWFSDRTSDNADDIWRVPLDANSERWHPTQKPVELPARAIRNSCPLGGLVFEPFAGVGSTLLACEQEGRTCAAIELSPEYCDVIVRRWEEFTGQTAQRAVTAEAAD